MNDLRTPSLRLALHGYPSLGIDGRPVALKLRHALALLAYLSQAPGPMGRTHLAALLWPEGEPALVRGRLRRLVHQTHEALGLAVFEGDGDALWLRAGSTSDLQATQAAIAAVEALARPPRAPGVEGPAPSRAGTAQATEPRDAAGRLARVAHAAEPLLAPRAAGWLEGFSLGTEAFDAWVDQARRAHVDALARALETASRLALAAQGTALAERLAAALLRLDPCSEAGHAARMAACAARGDAAGVETAYFECARSLREELGVAPSAALESAYAGARAAAQLGGTVPPAGAAAARPGPAPAIRHARTRLGHVAYADWGAGPGPDGEERPACLVLWGLMSNLEVALEEPRARALLDRLALRYRVVMLDRRGSGLAERVGVSPDAGTGVEDIVATLDALGLGRAWLFGSSVGGTLALEFALRQPARTAGLLLYGTSPVGRWHEDWPWALRASKLDDWIAGFTDPARYDESLRLMAPSVADDPEVRQWYARLLRNASTPHGAAALLRGYLAMDLRPRLAQVTAPTLVLQRHGDRIVPRPAGERLARAIPGARLQLLEGDDHFLWHGDTAVLEEAVHRFIDRHAEAPAACRLAA